MDVQHDFVDGSLALKDCPAGEVRTGRQRDNRSEEINIHFEKKVTSYSLVALSVNVKCVFQKRKFYHGVSATEREKLNF